MSLGTPPRRGSDSTPFWLDGRVRAVFYQILVLGILAAGIGWLVHNTLANLARQSITTGFGFLSHEAGFTPGESLIPIQASDSYQRVFLVGILNTLRVSLISIVLCTVLGTVIGISRLSSNWLVAKFAQAYVELLRNVPLALQLLFWYSAIRELVPGPRQALPILPGVFLSNRGLTYPVPAADPLHKWIWLGLLCGIVAAVATYRWARARQMRTGRPFPALWVGAALVVVPPLAVFLVGGAPLKLEVPALAGFNFRGGDAISPEFTTLLWGLTTYTASFVAEIVRGGIQAVSHGQTEAASALGLNRSQTLRLVILPQAFRIIVPPITSQYLNLLKNSSLAIIIGYPDLVAIANTITNQTGQPIEGVLLIMGAYAIVCLSIAGLMNWYNHRVALRAG